MNMLGKAISIAADGHLGVEDKGGKPYILHPIRLMMRLRTDDQELMSIAILHDVVEDTEWTLQQLSNLGFSKRIIDALDCLTHREGESYDDYIERIGTNIDAIRVKLEDLRDNSDITRLRGLTDKDLLRTRKYHRSFVRLKQLRDVHESIRANR